MTIGFDNPKQEELANDYDKLVKWCGKKTKATADEVLGTLGALQAAPTLYDMPRIPFHPHPLKGKFKGCFGIWVNKSERIIIRLDPGQSPPSAIDNYKSINKILIVELCTDYHGH